MNCRGYQRRREIVESYTVIPIAHIKLLNGFTVRSDAEANITDSYYVFSCVQKQTNIQEYATVGSGAARDFFKLTKTEPPPIFNPLKELSSKEKKVEVSKNNAGKVRQINTWNPARHQLYNAIMLIIICWHARPGGPLFSIKEDLERYYDRPLYVRLAKGVNTILGSHNKTVQDIINQLVENNKIKDYRFDLVHQLLVDNNVLSRFKTDDF